MKKIILGVALCYIVPKLHTLYQARKFIRENPEHPLAIKMQGDIDRMNASFKGLVDEIKDSWANSDDRVEFRKIMKNNDML